MLMGAVLLACATAADAQTWSGGEVPRDGACFYRDSDYRGPYFCVGGNDEMDSLPGGLSDNISSIRIFGRAEARVFKNSRFGGDAVSIRSDVRNLSVNDWNDAISSLQVRRTGGGGGNGPGFGRGQGNVEQIVRRAYQDVLQRNPDPEGMRTYRSRMIDDGWTEQDVRQALRESPEYREQNTMTMAKAQEIVRQAYLSVLNREPDPAARNYIDQVYRRRMTQQQVEAELRKSPEYRNR
jgi:hypothetical protein